MPTEIINRRFTPERHTPLTRNLATLVNEHYNGSIRAMARDLKCDHATLWRVIVGRTRAPSVTLLAVIGKRFQLTIDQLLA